MIHYIRLVWWIATILYMGKVTAEENKICACIPHEECSQVTGGKVPTDDKVISLLSPCNEPGRVYCCTSTLDKLKMLDMTSAVGQELDKERQIVKMINDFIGNVGNNEHSPKEIENSRQEKSIGLSTANGLNLDNKLHNQKPEKLFIVYPENNTKHIDEKNNLQIVLPIRKQQDKTLKDIGESYKIEQSVKQSNGKLPPTLHVHKSIGGSSKLHMLFPKRRVIPSTHKSEESTQQEDTGKNEDDLEISASEMDETSTQPSEATIKPLRTPPRHLARQEVKNEGPRQRSKSIHELFRSRSKNTTGLPEMQPNLNKMIPSENVTTVNVPKDVVAENINIMVINDLMKTNFSGRHASRFHNSALRHQPHTSTMASVTQGQASQKVTSDIESSLNENKQNSTAGTTQPTEERNNSAVLRKRLHMRRPGLRTLQSEPKGENNQEQTENPNLKHSPKGTIRKSLLTQRTGDPQVQGTRLSAEPTTTPQPIQNINQDRKMVQIAQRLKIKSMEPTSVFGARTSRFRQRPSQVETTSTTSIPIKNTEEPTESASPAAVPASQLKSSEFYSEQTTFPLEPESEEASQLRSGKSQDLESSGTTNHLTGVPFRGDFQPPTEMARGFQPMIINIQDLKTVGPLPGGFLEQSKSFNEDPDGFGLSLPSDAQPRSMSQSFDDFDYNSMLLPPVFLPPQLKAATESTPTTQDPFENASLLPPVQLPMPLMKEMLSDRATIMKIQEEFNVLKSQYDLLLGRYADTLRQYNDEYEKIIQSPKSSTES